MQNDPEIERVAVVELNPKATQDDLIRRSGAGRGRLTRQFESPRALAGAKERNDDRATEEACDEMEALQQRECPGSVFGPGGPPPDGFRPRGGRGPGARQIDATRFLRGVQVTDKAGMVEFETLYPGWYQGRTIHIHIKVRPGGDGARDI